MGTINGIWTERERNVCNHCRSEPFLGSFKTPGFPDSPLLETVVMFYEVSKWSEPAKPWVDFATGHIKHQWACEVAYFSALVQRGMRRNMSLAKILAPALLATRLLKRLPSPFGKSGDWSRLLAMILYSSLIFPSMSHAPSTVPCFFLQHCFR